MDQLKNALDIASESELILQKDIEYLATKYIKKETDLEIPMIFDNINLPSITYRDLFYRVYNKIKELTADKLFIDVPTLYTYIDYYFDNVALFEQS